MLNFMNMKDDYEDRKVDRYEKGDLMVSTASVTDSRQPFETAVSHPEYRDWEIVIVEMYDNHKEAEDGHKRWIAKMTADKRPDKLIDVSSAEVAEILDGVDDWRVFPRTI